jgi:hypothetical protein
MSGVSEALVERCMQLARDVANAPYFPGSGWAKVEPDIYDQARAIAAELPKPVDPDLLEARQIASDASNKFDRKGYESGQFDEWPMVKTILAAIKRGRELQRVGR